MGPRLLSTLPPNKRQLSVSSGAWAQRSLDDKNSVCRGLKLNGIVISSVYECRDELKLYCDSGSSATIIIGNVAIHHHSSVRGLS